MTLKRLWHIPKGLLKILVFGILLAVGAAVAMVRTQAGRDFIDARIEAAFTTSYAGSLEIGRLRGNPFDRLYISDVVLRDSLGHTVIDVDSLVLRFSVLDALKQSVTVRRATLIRPSLALHRTSNGSWNLEHVLERMRQSDDETEWLFRSADIAIIDGSISVSNDGGVPELVSSGKLFDYTNTAVHALHARMTFSWSADDRLIDLVHATAALDDGSLFINEFRGQLSIDDSSYEITELELATDRSRLLLGAELRSDGSLGKVARAPGEYDPWVSLRIREAAIDSQDVSLILPGSNLPSTTWKAIVSGPLSELNVDDFETEFGQTRVNLTGTIKGLPQQVDYALNFDESTLFPADIERLSPLPVASSELPPFELAGLSEGTFRVRSEDGSDEPTAVLSSDFELVSSIGALKGRFGFRHGRQDSLEIESELDFIDFQIGKALPALGPDAVFGGSGTVAVSGTGLSDVTGKFQMLLRDSSVRGLAFERLTASAIADQGLVRLDLSGTGSSGDITTLVNADFRDPDVDLRADGRFRQLDLATLLNPDPGSEESLVTASFEIEGGGSKLDDIRGQASLRLDTLSVPAGNGPFTMGPTDHSVTVSHTDSTTSRLVFGGDVVEGVVEGSFTFSALAKVTDLWLSAGVRTIQTQTELKRLHPSLDLAVEDVGREAWIEERRRTHQYLAATGLGTGLSLNVDLRIKRLIDLHRRWAAIPSEAVGLVLRAEGRFDHDRFSLSAALNADSLQNPGFGVDHLATDLLLEGPYGYSLESTLRSELNVEASRLNYGAQEVDDLSIAYSYSDRQGQIRIGTAADSVRSLAFGGSASLIVLDRHNTIEVTDAFIRKGTSEWELETEARFDIFGDAVRISSLRLSNSGKPDGDGETETQHVSIEGVVSTSPRDTLTINARDVRLDEFSDVAKLRYRIGGELDAGLRLTSVAGGSDADGDIIVENLAFDGRDVGNLRLNSTYRDPVKGFGISARIEQPRDPKITGVYHNDLTVTGNLRMPSDEDDGLLNLSVDIERLDMFLFEYIFSSFLADVQGYALGSGTITGDFSSPVFEADLAIEDGTFDVPPFNLSFGLTGPFSVDYEGFHLDDMDVTDPTGGTGVIRGDVLFNDYRFFSFDMSAELDDIMIMNVSRAENLSFYGEIWVSGSATLTGPLQQTLLRSTDAVTSQKSRVFLPVTDTYVESDQTFIVFADSLGSFAVEERASILSDRPQSERSFNEGMDMSLNIRIPDESSVYLVFDPLLGDMVHAVGSGRVQMERREGDISAFGTFNVESGDYLFTAGQVFQRRFELADGGSLTWDGDPLNARLDMAAVYRTRASLAGLPGQNAQDRVPIRIDMDLTGRVFTPLINLSIAVDLEQRGSQVIPPGLESLLNQSGLAAEYATSVLLTNTFLLTSSQGSDALTNTADELLFHSLSQLVSSQLNRFVSQALNLDVNLGVQQGRTEQEYDVVYGFALRLDEQRVVIRGEGLYETGENDARANQGLQGAFVLEYRLTPTFRMEFFFRRESDLYRAASTLGTAYGAGIVYQTDFANWRQFRGRNTDDTGETEEREPLSSEPPSDS